MGHSLVIRWSLLVNHTHPHLEGLRIFSAVPEGGAAGSSATILLGPQDQCETRCCETKYAIKRPVPCDFRLSEGSKLLSLCTPFSCSWPPTLLALSGAREPSRESWGRATAVSSSTFSIRVLFPPLSHSPAVFFGFQCSLGVPTSHSRLYQELLVLSGIC